jgi:hypothetical protein
LFLKTDGAGNLSFSSDLPTTSFTGATVETSIAGGDLVLVYDDSATAVRKMTRTNFIAGVGGTNTPAFRATKSANQTIANATGTKVTFPNEDFDTSSCYDTSTSRFTPNVAGKYFVGAQVRWDTGTDIDIADTDIYKNGSVHQNGRFSNIRYNNWFIGSIVTMNGTTDYIEIFVTHTVGGNLDVYSDGHQFFAYKLIE